MINHIIVRRERQDDYAEVECLTFAAFEHFEAEGVPKRNVPNEHFLVHLLREDSEFVPELDFVAECGGEIIGNIMYSKCTIHRSDETIIGALVFGPVSVKPERQRQGVGTLLVTQSLSRARELGYKAVIITGHPQYYLRFGFIPASRYGLTMPDGASLDAFMALELENGYLGTAGGKWKCCKAFETVEKDEADGEVAFRRFHGEFTARERVGGR